MRKLSEILLIIFIFSLSESIAQRIDLSRAPRFKDEILTYENFIEENAPKEEAFIAIQRLAAPFISDMQWEKAAMVFQKYKNKFPQFSDRFDKIIDLLLSDEEILNIQNLGKNINTDSNEYLPIISIDGKKLFFCSDSRLDGIGGEDIFSSELLNGQWMPSKPMDSTINTTDNEAMVSISADGNRIILFGNYNDSFGGGDLYYSDKTTYGWQKPKHYPKPINTSFFDADGMYSSDGKIFIFTSDRPGGTGSFIEKGDYFHGSNSGNTEIYICLVTEKGFSEPINLGPTINTPFAERTPYLHPDGKTLYFSSDGHYGLGKLDVFKSVRLYDSSWTDWSEPVNLGKEINTPGNDWGYQINIKGDLAYFSSRNKKSGFGGEDIYSVTLPQKVKPKAVATIKGIVMDKKGNPLSADIRWEDLSSDENMGNLKSDPITGNYFIVLPLGKNYGYYAVKKGYYPAANNIDLKNKDEYLELNENIILISFEDMIKDNTWVRINNIFFETNKYNLNKESFPELNRLVQILNENPTLKIEIAGHTDNIGSEKFNLDLSKRRAQSVIDYLISKGSPKNNLSAIGFGMSKPVSDNQSEKGRALNRRVEFRFIK